MGSYEDYLRDEALQHRLNQEAARMEEEMREWEAFEKGMRERGKIRGLRRLLQLCEDISRQHARKQGKSLKAARMFAAFKVAAFKRYLVQVGLPRA